jgi:hypothetical protein
MWRIQLAAFEEGAQRLARDAIPSLQGIQLLRTLAEFRQEASNPDISPARPVLAGVRAADGQLHLPGMLGSARNCAQQQRPGGDRDRQKPRALRREPDGLLAESVASVQHRSPDLQHTGFCCNVWRWRQGSKGGMKWCLRRPSRTAQ